MQVSTTDIGSLPIKPFESSVKKRDVFYEIFASCCLNIGICLYQLKKNQIKILSFSQVVSSLLKTTHPLIPLLTLPLTLLCLKTISLNGSKKRDLVWLKNVQKFARFSMVSMLALKDFVILIHEAGHLLSSYILFKKPQTVIHILSFQEGSTRYAASFGLTRIGQLFGTAKARLIITAGGVLSSTLTAFLMSSISKLIEKDYPNLSEILNNLQITLLLSELIYAISSLIDHSNLSNDFTYLFYEQSIHPFIPIITLSLLIWNNHAHH